MIDASYLNFFLFSSRKIKKSLQSTGASGFRLIFQFQGSILAENSFYFSSSASQFTFPKTLKRIAIDLLSLKSPVSYEKKVNRRYHVDGKSSFKSDFPGSNPYKLKNSLFQNIDVKMIHKIIQSRIEDHG